MADYRDLANDVAPAWCPGCGNYAIRNATQRALAEAGLEPHQVLIVTGIGQASKVPDYMTVNSLTTLHGRPIPIAQGAHLAHHGMKVIVHAGDGDTFGLGGNHYIHMMRRNADITLMVHDNLIYGLTKGQYSPTSPQGFASKTSPPPVGAIERPVNPLGLALTNYATFVARTFAGDVRHMIDMMVMAIEHVRLLSEQGVQTGGGRSRRYGPGRGPGQDPGMGRPDPYRGLLPRGAGDA